MDASNLKKDKITVRKRQHWPYDSIMNHWELDALDKSLFTMTQI